MGLVDNVSNAELSSFNRVDLFIENIHAGVLQSSKLGPLLFTCDQTKAITRCKIDDISPKPRIVHLVMVFFMW